MTTQALGKVDHAALKANQLTIIVISLAAFILNLPGLAALVAVIMGLGTLFKAPGFLPLYRFVYKPLGLLQSEVLDDQAEPHRFAQFLGCLFMAGGSWALWMGSGVLGWGLVWLVVALAALNAFGGFCVGCAVYYWLSRVGAPGFTKAPPAGTYPGMKPSRRA